MFLGVVVTTGGSTRDSNKLVVPGQPAQVGGVDVELSEPVVWTSTDGDWPPVITLTRIVIGALPLGRGDSAVGPDASVATPPASPGAVVVAATPLAGAVATAAVANTGVSVGAGSAVRIAGPPGVGVGVKTTRAPV